jgi:hypothetical protein
MGIIKTKLSTPRKVIAVIGILLGFTIAANSVWKAVQRLDEPSAEERAAYAKKEILTIIQNNRSKTCKRPVLRGTPLEGAAALDIISAVEISSETKACFDLFDGDTDELRDLLYFKCDAPPQGYPIRSISTARPLNTDADNSERLDSIRSACISILESIRQATQHEDACSPYRIGVRKFPSIVSFLRASVFLPVFIRDELANGRTKEAFEMALDLLRFSQDLERGGVGWLVAIVASHTMRPVFSIMEMALNRPEPIGEDLLLQIRDELTALINTTPSPLSHFSAELDVPIILPAMKDGNEVNWPAPRHWSQAEEDDESTMLDGLFSEIDDKFLKASLELKRMAGEACPDDGTPYDCIENVRSLTENMESPTEKGIERAWRFWKASVWGEADEALHQETVKMVNETSKGSLWQHILIHEQHRFYLAAIRLLVDYRLMAETTAICPEMSIFKGKANFENRRDPYSGKLIKILISANDDIRFVILPPIPILPQKVKSKHDAAVVANCPLIGGKMPYENTETR